MSARSIILAALVGATLAPASVAEDATKPKKGPPTLDERCRKLLRMQAEVHDGLAALRREIASSKDKKASPAQKRAAQQLAKKQKAVTDEVGRAVKGLPATGVAIAEVLRSLRNDMHALQRRLENCDIKEKAQALSVDIVDTINELLRALTRR